MKDISPFIISHFSVIFQSFLVKSWKWAYCNIVRSHLHTVNIVCSHSGPVNIIHSCLISFIHKELLFITIHFCILWEWLRYIIQCHYVLMLCTCNIVLFYTTRIFFDRMGQGWTVMKFIKNESCSFEQGRNGPKINPAPACFSMITM
jgi:hypothetical protein